MKRNIVTTFTRFFAAAAMVVGIASCEADLESVDLDDESESEAAWAIAEQAVLDLWIEERADSLIDNRQDAGYYLYNITRVEDNGLATNAGNCWVRYNITTRDMEGNIILTRNESEALLQGTFSYYTHYAPYKREVTSDSDEAIDLAFLDTSLVIDGEATSFYAGSKFLIIIPSYLAGSSYNGTGGYAGQSTLSSNRPMMSEIEIIEVISDIDTYETNVVDEFTVANGSFTWSSVAVEDDGVTTALEGVYLNHDYTPQALNYIEPYGYGSTHGITDIQEMNDSIATLLIERFGSGVTTGDVITESESSNIWYIARFLDGFVVDTNIEEVRALVFDDSTNSTSEVVYEAESDNGSHVDMWLYTIPEMKYGQWAAIVGTSDYGYGSGGRDDDGASSEILSYTPLMFEIYVEPIEYD